MKYCRRCGTQMDDTVLFCPTCGSDQGGNGIYYERPVWYAADDNKSHPWIATLSFIFIPLAIIFFAIWRYSNPSKARSAAKGGFMSVSFSYPIVGLILFFVFHESRPGTAKACGISAIVGFCLSFVLTIVAFVLVYQYGVDLSFLESIDTGLSMYIR